MITLAMDTAQGACSSALLRDGNVLAHRFELMRQGHAERLLPQVLEVMAEAGVEMPQLSRLACTIGPGTFTGTRIALSAARGMALALDIPLIGVTTLEALASAIEPNSNNIRVSLFDAKRGEVYVQVFDGTELTALSEPACLSLERAGEVIADAADRRSIKLAGTGAPLLLDQLPGAEMPNVPAHPDALQVARLAEGRCPVDGPVSPLYLRAPDAKLPGGIELGQQ